MARINNPFWRRESECIFMVAMGCELDCFDLTAHNLWFLAPCIACADQKQCYARSSLDIPKRRRLRMPSSTIEPKKKPDLLQESRLPNHLLGFGNERAIHGLGNNDETVVSFLVIDTSSFLIISYFGVLLLLCKLCFLW